MKNPATPDRVSRVSPASITPETFSLSAMRASMIAARFAIPLETAAIVASLYFMEAR